MSIGVVHPMTEPRIIELDNPIRDYAWGSPTEIPRLLGIPATGRPAAELWVGAHPDSPSRSISHPDQPGLDALIQADPAGLLGPAVAAEFGPRLPFLLKVLAAERALSMQVHPNLAQARAGYQAEQAAGVPAGSPERNYSDANHKPELAYAISTFDAFCGFRPVARTVELLDALQVQQLRAYRELLAGPDGLRATFSALLTVRGTALAELVSASLAGCRRLASADGEWAGPAAASVLAGEDFPGDIGPVLALLLNFVRLAPGEAIFLGAGTVHAYLRGVCLEVLANSDNVLRCGLTGKHVDVEELIRIADFSPLAEPRWPAIGDQFRVPVPDFVLTVRQLAGERPGQFEQAGQSGPAELADTGPHLVLAGEQPVTVTSGSASRSLRPWHAAFVAAGRPAARLAGTGRAFVVSTGVSTGLPD
jgi:mannose-6-phosphate isomerase